MQPAVIPQKTHLYGVIFGLQYLILAVVCSVIAATAAGSLSAIILLLANPLQTSAQLTTDVINTSLGSGVIFLLLSIPLIIRAYHHQELRIEEGAIVINHGFFKKKSASIPYSDIHYTSITENPVQHILALSTIHIYLTNLKTPKSFTVYGYDLDTARHVQELILVGISQKKTRIEDPWKQSHPASNTITESDYQRPKRWYWYTALSSAITSFILTNVIFFIDLNSRRRRFSHRPYESIASHINDTRTLIIAITVTALLLTVAFILHQLNWKRNRSFICMDEAIWIKQGGFFKHFICIPVSTIVQIDVRESTLESLFALATTYIRTTQQGDLSKKMYYTIANPFYLSSLSSAQAHKLAKAINEKYKKETLSPATGGWMRA